MSDCSNSSMQPYDVARLRIEFQDGEVPWMYPLALNGRTISGVYVDNMRYERVRECHDENNHEFNGFTCSECSEWTGYDEPWYCPWCGAKVVEDGE